VNQRIVIIGLVAIVILSGLGLLWWRITMDEPVDTALRSANVPFTSGTVHIDGRLDEPAWNDAVVVGPFVLSDGSAKAPLDCTARLMWDDNALYVGFEAVDRDLISPHTDRDDAIYTKDVVEIFLDPEGDKRDYMELQVSPRGVIFDARFPSYRENLSKSQLWNAPGLQVATTVRGSLDDGDGDEGWTAEFRILFAALQRDTPKPNETWRANLFRIDMHQKGGHYTAWTPPLVGDFHTLDRFGHLKFVRPPTSDEPTPSP
jgi:hypothetical protein